MEPGSKGTSDLKPHLCRKALGPAFGMRRLAQIVVTYPFEPSELRPRVLLPALPVISGPAQARTLDCFAGRFGVPTV